MTTKKKKLETPAEETAQSVSSPDPTPTPPDGVGLQTVSPPAGGTDAFDPTRPAVPSLADQLCEVRSRLSSVPKNGSMSLGKGPRIEYVKIDDLMEVLRPVFASCGVDFRVGHSPEHPPTKDGRDWIVLCKFTYTSAVTGEVAEEWSWGQGSSIAIAQTYAVKYHLLRSLLIGGGDADDEVANAPQERGNGRSSAPPAAQRGNGQAPRQAERVDRTTLIVKRIFDAMRVHDDGDRSRVVERIQEWIEQYPDRLGPVLESGEHAGFPHFKVWTEQQCSFLEQLYRGLDAAAEQEIPF